MKKTLFLLLFTSLLFSGEYLLKKGEKLLFGFKTKSGKVVSIVLGPKKSYLLYRFGKKNRVEFEYPKDRNNSFTKFSYYHYMRPSLGGTNAGEDLSHFYFSNNGYTYDIYEEYFDEESSHNLGIIVCKGKKRVAKIKGKVKSKKGSLLNIEDLIDDGLPINKSEDLDLPDGCFE